MAGNFFLFIFKNVFGLRIICKIWKAVAPIVYKEQFWGDAVACKQTNKKSCSFFCHKIKKLKVRCFANISRPEQMKTIASDAERAHSHEFVSTFIHEFPSNTQSQKLLTFESWGVEQEFLYWTTQSRAVMNRPTMLTMLFDTLFL